MSDVHVILINWNSAKDTIECLESMTIQEGVSLEFVVVDNFSEDNSVQLIRERFPQVHIIECEENLGFQVGNNVGIQYALDNGAKNIFILNNDTIAKPDLLTTLLPYLSSTVGAVTPAIFYHSHPDKIWSLGGRINPIFLEMVNFSFGQKSLTLPDAPIERDFITGCAMLVKAEVLRDVGLFDERFFPIYYEDMDLSLRIRRKGYKMLLVPQAHLFHKVSQSGGGQTSPRVVFLMSRNSGIYFRKHMRLWNLPFILAFRFASALRTSVKYIFHEKFDCLAAYWGGLADGWLGISLTSGRLYLSRYKK